LPYGSEQGGSWKQGLLPDCWCPTRVAGVGYRAGSGHALRFDDRCRV